VKGARKSRSAPRRRPRRLTLRISYDADFDFLWALKFGETVDGHLPDEIEEPADGFSAFWRGPNGPVIGFGVEDVHDFELPEPEHPLMPGFRFDAPTLGIRDASAEEVVLVARSAHLGHSTPDVVFFDMAVESGTEPDEDPEEAEFFWRLCLAAGDPKAHFGLGYTLCDLGRHREAYGHLLEYRRIVPRNPWAWSWLGQACEGIEEPRQAARCYRRAIRLELEGGFETDAGDLLELLEPRRPRRTRKKR